MSQLTAETTDISSQIDNAAILYSVSDAKIAEIRARCALMKADSREGYEEVRLAIATTRKLRVEIEKQRESLKRPALDYGKRVDAEAKRLTTELESIESPLQAEKDRVDAEKARIKKEREEAERIRIEAENRAKVEAQMAQLRAEREAEAARIKAEQEAAAARLAEERKAIEDERNRQALERQRIEEENRAAREVIAAEQRRVEEARRIENERIAAERAKMQAEYDAIQSEKRRIAEEKAARDCAERDAEEAKQRAIAEAEESKRAEAQRLVEEEEAARMAEAIRPDVEKIRQLGKSIGEIFVPGASTPEGRRFCERILGILLAIQNDCFEFGCKKPGSTGEPW